MAGLVDGQTRVRPPAFSSSSAKPISESPELPEKLSILVQPSACEQSNSATVMPVLLRSWTRGQVIVATQHIHSRIHYLQMLDL